MVEEIGEMAVGGAEDIEGAMMELGRRCMLLDEI